MKYAHVDGERCLAKPGLSGKCPSCEQEMLAKCGDVKVWHWAHKGRRICDPWWENETEWHRTWKNHFPESWQEVVHRDDFGEKHIADVKTNQGWAIEFQHSYMKPEERQSRDAFYPKLVWVVDGLRRKRDLDQFKAALSDGHQVGGGNSQLRRVRSESCNLVQEWSASNSPIFIDFGGGRILWWLVSGSPDGWSYIAPFSSADFIKLHVGQSEELACEFEEFIGDIQELVQKYELDLSQQARAEALRQASTLYGREAAFRNAARRARKRRWF